MDQPDAAASTVHRLTLTRFRNYRSARVTVGPAPVVLTGPNGAGKTNLLEALSFLAPGRGLRQARLREVEQQGAPPPDLSPGWAVAATVTGRLGPVEIGTGSAPGDDGGERRLVRIDGRTARASALAEQACVLWLTPAMDRLFLEGAAGRRRFLDRLVYAFDPAHAGRVARYEQALRERARLLRDGCRDDAWLSGLESVLAATGVAVAAARRDLVDRLNAATSLAVGPFPRPGLSLSGRAETQLRHQPALLVEDQIRGALRAARAGDAESGGSTIGPHRSDLEVTYLGPANRDDSADSPVPAAVCSTGEQKALLISLVLAHARLLAAERSLTPLLLLDEIAAHLDPNRRAALFDDVVRLGCQAWMTGTDASLFAPLRERATFFTVAAAQITADH